MLNKIRQDGCLYQDDVVDLMVKNNLEKHLKENADGNLVLGSKILKVFKEHTQNTVVWVLKGRYWRKRVKEDDYQRTAKG